MLEVQTNFDEADSTTWEIRSSSIRHLLKALGGLIQAANEHEHDNDNAEPPQRTGSIRVSSLSHAPKLSVSGLAARRTRLAPELWEDTLTLLCDRDERIRNDYYGVLIYYLSKEMQKYGELCDVDGVKKVRRLSDGALLRPANINTFLQAGDAVSKLLNSINAYLYILLSNPTSAFDIQPPCSSSQANVNGNSLSRSPADEPNAPPLSRASSQGPKARKASLMRRLTLSTQEAPITTASKGDYKNASTLLVATQDSLPIRGLLCAIPMLHQLERELDDKTGEQDAVDNIKNIILDVWTSVARNWECSDLLDLCSVRISAL